LKQLELNRKAISLVLLVMLVSVFFSAGIVITVEASQKAEFHMLYILTGYAEQERVNNDRFHQYKLFQTGYIDQSDILLDEGILGASIYFDWIATHNKQSDVARASGTFEIISSENVVLMAGTVKAVVKDFSTGAPIVEVIYLGHGQANIWGITEDIGFLIPIDVDGYYW